MAEIIAGALARPSPTASEAAARPLRRSPEERAAAAAVAFEATFLAEMLKQGGLGKALGGMTGGAGESGFTDLLTREIAERIARARPLGIAESIAPRLPDGRP